MWLSMSDKVYVCVCVNSHEYKAYIRLNGETEMLVFPHYSVSNTVFSCTQPHK